MAIGSQIDSLASRIFLADWKVTRADVLLLSDHKERDSLQRLATLMVARDYRQRFVEWDGKLLRAPADARGTFVPTDGRACDLEGVDQ